MDLRSVNRSPPMAALPDAVIETTNGTIDAFIWKLLNTRLLFVEIKSCATGKACVSLSALFLDLMGRVFQPDYCLWCEESLRLCLATCCYFISLALLESL